MIHSRRTFLERTTVAGATVVGATNAIGTVGASDDEARVEGTVAEFGHPVEDATVEFDRENDDAIATETDEDGAFARSIASGTYVMTVTADGYGDETRSISIGAGETVTANVRLEPTWGSGEGELEVFATKVGGGRTIPCHVTVYGDEVYDTVAPLGSVPDDENWGRGFVVSEGWWEIRVSNADGYSDGYERVYVEDGETAFGWVELSEGEETIPHTGTLAGRLTDASGEPIDDATLAIGGERVSIGADGSFEREVPHGRHEVAASAPGFDSKRGTVEVRFARTTNLSVTLDAGPEAR